MDLFVSVDGQQQGPLPLMNLHEIAALGSLAAEALVWSQEKNSWIPLKAYLLAHPLPSAEDAKKGKSGNKQKPSAIRGFFGALLTAIVVGGIISGIGILAGAFFPIFWWALAWGCGEAAKAWGGRHCNLMGLFAFITTMLGIMFSFSCLDYGHPVIILGGLGMLISLPGSLWLAFKTGRTP